MMQLTANIIETGKALGGTAELPTGNGNAQAPVGTTVALLEQAQVNISAVHKRLHQAQGREFQLLKDRFREDPEAFWRFNPRPSHQWQQDEFLAALNSVSIVPASDPNTAGAVQRALKASAVLQMAQQSPESFNIGNVIRYALSMLNIGSPETLLNVAGLADAQPSPMEQATIEAAKARIMDAETRRMDAETRKGKAVADVSLKTAELQQKQEALVVNAGTKVAIEAAKKANTQTQLIETLSDEANRRLLAGVQ